MLGKSARGFSSLFLLLIRVDLIIFLGGIVVDMGLYCKFLFLYWKEG